MTCNIHFGNQDGSQDRFYYKYASVTDAVFSMRTGTYTGTEFKINKNGIIPLYGEVNGDTGETEEDVAMFNKGARYKISCYRTDSDNAKLPLYTDGKSPSIAAGTEFVILNIVMPESYVTMAENTLEKAALDYLSRYDHENRTVSLDISSGFVAEHPNLFIDFIEGNMLKVRDDGIGVFDFSDNGQIVDMQLQIQSLEIKYSKENMFPSYSCTIARRKILSFYERLAQENQTASTQNTTNVTLGGSGTGSGTNIFSEQLLNDLIASFQKFNGWFEWDEVNQALRCKSAFYTNQWISALGAQSGSGEPGGGEGGLIKAVYGFADLGKTFDDSNLSNTFNAYTINEIWKLAKEGGMNTDKLWQELGKDDPTKKIHISHIPDNKFVTLATDQAITGNKTFTNFIRINDTKGLSYSGNTVFRNSSGNTVISSFGDGMIYFRPNGDTSDVGVIQINKQGHLNGVSAGFTGGVSAARLTANEYIQIGDAQLVYDSANKALRVKHRTDGNTVGFYSDGWVSALGVKTGGSGGGSGVVNTVYSFANLTDGTTFSDSDLDNTFNAYTIKKLYDMAGQGGLDADAMWAELKKADSSKIIDASHIPTSVLDGRWVTLSTNQTITGQKTFTQQLKSTVATGLSPLIVSSNTLVNNLNADLLDGYHQSKFLRTDGVNQHVTLTGGNGNTEGYRLVLEATVPGGWSVNSMTLLVNSRHSGTGIISLVFHTINKESTSYEGSLNYYGSTTQHGGTTMWRLFYNTTTKKIRLFWHYYDYNDCQVSILNRVGVTTNISDGTWYTTLPSDNGNELPSYYNRSDSTGSLATSRTLWGQPFNGTANVSGNMTGVGSINMSGVLTIKNSTYNKQLIIWSAGYTAKNQGEGILFRCDDATQGVVLRHEWYDTFVPGYGLAVSKHDSLEAGDANMFFYNTGRFISKAPQGTSPYQCVSTTVNANLNADLLDGFHAERFLLSVGRSDGTFDLNTYSERAIKEIRTIEQTTNNAPFAGYGLLANLWDSNKFAALQIGGTSADLFFRGKHDGTNKITSAWHRLLHTENYASIADGRYVKKAGDTMTGDLTMNNTKGFNMGWSTRVVKTTGVWIHGGGDAASSTDANLRFGSLYGIGWYPTISGQTVTQGNNAMWLNVRNGNLDTHGAITAHTNYLAANWDSARRLVLGGGSSYAYIDSRNSSNNVLCNIVLEDNKVFIGNYVESSRFVSTVGTGTQPYQCSSTTLNSNLNADMLDNWHLNFLPRNYNIGRCYAVRFALGGGDNGWKKIFACSESGTGPYKSVTVWGRIWYAYGNHAQSEVWNYHFCAIFYMRSGPSSSDSSVGTVENSARLYLPTFAKGMDNIRLVRVGTNNFELQVRQIGSYHNANIEYQYLYYGCNVSAWENLQSTSNTSVAVSAGGASTLADSRASSADVWTTARTFYIQDHNASHTGAGVSVNGSANVYLKLPNSIQCSGWFRSTGNSGWYHQDYGGGIYMQDSAWVRVFGGKRFYVENGDNTDFNAATAISTEGGIYARKNITSSANIIANGAVTAKASSSDIRLKTDIQGYDAMGIIRKFRSVKYHWNAIAKENSEVFNHDNWNYGLIAQDLLSGGYSQWVKDAFNDYYTIDYERLIPVVWKGLQEVDDEVTRLKKRVKELEKRLGINN